MTTQDWKERFLKVICLEDGTYRFAKPLDAKGNPTDSDYYEKEIESFIESEIATVERNVIERVRGIVDEAVSMHRVASWSPNDGGTLDAFSKGSKSTADGIRTQIMEELDSLTNDSSKE